MPLLVEPIILAEEELVPIKLASTKFQLVVGKAKELEVQLLKQELESTLRQVALQELVKQLLPVPQLEVAHHPPQMEEYYYQQLFPFWFHLNPRQSDFEAAISIGVVRTIVETQGSTVAIEELSSIGVVLVVIVGTIATVMVAVVEELQHIVVITVAAKIKLMVPTRTASEELIVAKEAFATTRIVEADLPQVGCLNTVD